MKDFRFTSWIHNEELVLWDHIHTKEVKNLEIINWAKYGWNYKNATSSHHHWKMPLRTLWLNPIQFVFNRTVSLVCQNGFSPKESMALGSIQFIYHLMYLSRIFFVYRYYALCKSSFQERLYELLGKKFHICHQIVRRTLKMLQGFHGSALRKQFNMKLVPRNLFKLQDKHEFTVWVA